MSLAQSMTQEDLKLLEEMGPGLAALESLRDRMLAGALSVEHNRVQGQIEPPADDDVHDVPSDEAEFEHLRELGEEAIRQGAAGVVLLNGGMATRFGGVVKGTVSVDGEHSFLGLKLLDLVHLSERLSAPPPVVILMNSRATAQATRAHLQEHDYFGYPSDRVWSFEQQWSPRMTPAGDIFLVDGQPSFYGPGHGDLLTCLRRSGLARRFEADGGTTLLMSNVDNAVATLDPALLGWHLNAGKEVTVEVVDKWQGDAGGAPARVDGDLQVVEAFRFPVGFDADRVGVFNTNTFWFQLSALSVDHPLTWFLVHKKVGDLQVVQFERLIGEITAFVPSVFMRVPRKGQDTRFEPIKSPDDLKQAAKRLMTAWRARCGA